MQISLKMRNIFILMYFTVYQHHTDKLYHILPSSRFHSLVGEVR